MGVSKQDADDFLSKTGNETNINIRGPTHLAAGLLPHLKSKPYALVVNVSSVLASVPFAIIIPICNGAKAWPPTVAAGLHPEREDPDHNKKHKNPRALSVEGFVDEVGRKWEQGEETIGAGMGADLVSQGCDTFGGTYPCQLGNPCVT